ncbi:MAG: pimeloyl-ACP methyl ester carboxylesterase [Alteromonadaceae bacterium]|jgi:pimeloyl-ACP methyl ester carboxylesterase
MPIKYSNERHKNMYKNLPSGIYVSGQGPAVILLHSSLSSARQWLPLVNMLTSNHLVINVDILGYGKADDIIDPDNYNFDVEIARIKKVIKVLIPTEKYHLVGHSCGGAIALKLAVEAPENVLSMSLYEPVAFHLLSEGSDARKQSDLFAKKVDIDDKYQAAEIFTDFWNKDGFFKTLPQKMQDYMAADMAKVRLDFKGLISETYSENDLQYILCDTLLLRGINSPELSHILINKIAMALPHVEQVTFNAGHMGPIDNSSIIQPVIANFIKER